MQNFLNLFDRNKINQNKLIIETLNTSFEITENVRETYFKLLCYTINNSNVINEYKTKITLIDNNKKLYFSTYTKII